MWRDPLSLTYSEQQNAMGIGNIEDIANKRHRAVRHRRRTENDNQRTGGQGRNDVVGVFPNAVEPLRLAGSLCI